jgi:hypothetical protein
VGLYLMVGTTDRDCWQGRGEGFNAFRSKDLQTWEGPLPAFRPPVGFWARNGHLLMLWSGMGRQGYAMAIARSVSGSVVGPWTEDPEPIYGRDGGHGRFFRSFDGRLMMTLHTPNRTPHERPVFILLEEAAEGFRAAPARQ